MGIFYKIPIQTVVWGRSEVYEVIKSLFVRHTSSEAQKLATYIDEYFDGQLTLVNSGRSALELALRQIRQRTDKPKAVVLTPSLICRAVPDKILAAGLTPDFYDLGPDLSPSIESLLAAVRPDTVAVVFPYLYGKVVPVETVVAMCRNAGITLIEDCAASFLLPDCRGRLSGTNGDYVIFSFQRGKTVAAGSGGALLQRTGVAEPYDVKPWTSRELRMLHVSKIIFMLEEVFVKTGYLMQRAVGLPSDFARSSMEQIHPISDLDCSLVLKQLEKWPFIVESKTHVLKRYGVNFGGSPRLRLAQASSKWFANRIFVKFSRRIASRPAPHVGNSTVADYMRKKGIEVHFSYFPAHRIKEFAGYSSSELPITEEFFESLLEIPSQPTLRDDEIDYVSECLLQAC